MNGIISIVIQLKTKRRAFKMRTPAKCFTFLMCFIANSNLVAQGTIGWNNTATTLITVNGSTMPARVSPETTYYFALFVAPLGTPSSSADWQVLAYATNRTTTAGRFLTGGTATAVGYAGGSNVNFMVRGWRTYSGAFADWQTVQNNMGQVPSGNYPIYFGESAVGTAILGGLSPDGGNYPVAPAFAWIGGFNLSFSGCPECVSPFFYVQPSSTVVGLGGNVTFRAYSGIWPSTSYEWRKAGLAIAGANSSTLTVSNLSVLTITNVTLGDAGNYDVVAYNSYGSSTSSVATLTVLTPAVLAAPAYSSNNQFQFAVNGQAGSNYVVQVATNLVSSSVWTSLFTNTSPFTFVDATVSNSPQRFYRAQAR